MPTSAREYHINLRDDVGIAPYIGRYLLHYRRKNGNTHNDKYP